MAKYQGEKYVFLCVILVNWPFKIASDVVFYFNKVVSEIN